MSSPPKDAPFSVFTCFKPVVVNSVRCMFCFMFANGSFCCFLSVFLQIFWASVVFHFSLHFYFFLEMFSIVADYSVSLCFYCNILVLGSFLHSLVQCVILVLFLYWYSLFFLQWHSSCGTAAPYLQSSKRRITFWAAVFDIRLTIKWLLIC